MAHREQARAVCGHAPRKTSRPSSGNRQGCVTATRDTGLGGRGGRAEEDDTEEELRIGIYS